MRKVLTPVLVLAVIVSLGVYQREVLAEILARLIDLPRISLVPLAVAACAMVCARGFFLLSCSPGITFRQAVIADQTALAAGCDCSCSLVYNLGASLPVAHCSRDWRYCSN
jgi:hypothetical protein